MTNLDSILKSRDITSPAKVRVVKTMIFPVVMYGCESSTIKKAERRKIDAFELWCWRRLLWVPWTVKRSIQSVHPKGNQSWIFIGRAYTEVEAPILWTLDVKNWLIWKDHNAGKDGRWEESETTENETVGWHHWLNGLEFEWTLGVGDGQVSLLCCCLRSCKRSDTTEWLNLTVWIFTNFMNFYEPHCKNKHELI